MRVRPGASLGEYRKRSTERPVVNQRAILKRRAALVDELYNAELYNAGLYDADLDAHAPSARVIVCAAVAARNQGRVS